MELFRDKLTQFVNSINSTAQSGVIYDTAILGALSDKMQFPIFPRLVRSVLDRQYEDGSWGAPYYQPYDRLLSTTASLYMITELNLQDNNVIDDIFAHGISWIEEHEKACLDSDYPIPVAFEFLYPKLITSVMQNTSLLNVSLHGLAKHREQKLARVGEMLYTQPTPLFFSMEGIVESKEDAEQLAKFQTKNGSLGASPSSTSIFLRYRVKSAMQAARRYVDKMITPGGLVKHFGGYQYMNAAFSMYPLFKSGYQFTGEALSARYLLDTTWGDWGISFGPSFPVPDADDTAVGIYALNRYGERIDDKLNILLKYEREDHFASYPFEQVPALMTNMHIYDLFKTVPHAESDRITEKIEAYLRNNIKDKPELNSKYNASPYYHYGNILLAISRTLPELAKYYKETLITRLMRHVDSSGWASINSEEMAHALLGLLFYQKHRGDVDKTLIETLHTHLMDRTDQTTQLEETYTWTSKVQYHPQQMAASQIYGSHFLYMNR